MSNSRATITVPKVLLEKLEDSFEEMQEIHEELENILLSKDALFLKKMRQARLEHRRGKVRPLKEIKAALCIK